MSFHFGSKNKSLKLEVKVCQLPEPTEKEISDYAYHLYQQDGSEPGHDLEHWFEATNCLKSAIPRGELSHSH